MPKPTDAKKSLLLSAESSRQILLANGVKTEDCGLVIPETLSDAGHASISTALRRLGRGFPWWVGDYAISCQARKGEHYAGPLAERLGLDQATIHNAAQVCRFFKVSVRTETLTFTHHRIAMYGAGAGTDAQKVKNAQAWLFKADAGQWSPSMLRQEIARAGSTATVPSTHPEPNLFAPLDQADAWATKERDTIAALDRAAAVALLSRFSSLIEVIDRLRAIASP